MTKALAAAIVALLLSLGLAGPATAGCVAIGWTNGHGNHPIWKCSD